MSDVDSDSENERKKAKYDTQENAVKTVVEESISEDKEPESYDAKDIDVEVWSQKHVFQWIEKHFDNEVAENFKKEEINGETLLSKRLSEPQAMEKLGLRTLGKQEHFKKLVNSLKVQETANVHVPGGKSTNGRKDLKQIDRLLTHKEKLQLTCENKQLYNTKKKLILQKIKEQWPQNQPIPSFRRQDISNLKDLGDFVKKLGDSSKYTLPSCGLGPLAIKQIVMNHMRERRRQNQMSASYITSGETTTETEIDSESQSEASTTESSPPSSKKDQYAQYFHSNMTQESCNTIILVSLEKGSIKDVHVSSDLMELKKKFKLFLLRGQNKDTFIRAIANSLLRNGYVTIKSSADLSNLRREDVTRVKLP